MSNFLKILEGLSLTESQTYKDFNEFWDDRGMAIYRGSFQEVSSSDLKSALREAFNEGVKSHE